MASRRFGRILAGVRGFAQAVKKKVTANSEESKKRSLANLVPYKPGQSGNPDGRPKKKPITELYEEILADGATIAQLKVAVKAMLLSGKMAAQLQLKEMAERVEGKVTQPVEVNGELNLTLTERMERAEARLRDGNGNNTGQ